MALLSNARLKVQAPRLIVLSNEKPLKSVTHLVEHLIVMTKCLGIARKNAICGHFSLFTLAVSDKVTGVV